MRTNTCCMIFFLLMHGIASISQTNNANSKPVINTAKKNNSFSEGKDYTVFERVRVTDNTGFTTPVEAYSLLLPKTWKYEGNINWVYNMQSPAGNGTYNYLKAVSADNNYSLEILPEIVWSWVSDPQLLQFMQANTRSPYAFVAAPMGAEQYLRGVFINNELSGGTITGIKQNTVVMQEMQQNFEKVRNELMQYGASDVQFYPSAINAGLNFKDGKEAIVLCGVTVIETTLMNQYNGSVQKNYTSSAVRRIIFRFPAEEKESAEKMLGVILSSLRTNTAWKNNVNAFWKQLRQNSDVANRQKIKMMDEQTKAIGNAAISKGAQNLKNMDVNLRSWEEGQASQDKMNVNFIKAIREVETYRDVTGKIELGSGYNHAWSRGDGTSFILSNNPAFDPSSALQDQRWTEMKLVK